MVWLDYDVDWRRDSGYNTHDRPGEFIREYPSADPRKHEPHASHGRAHGRGLEGVAWVLLRRLSSFLLRVALLMGSSTPAFSLYGRIYLQAFFNLSWA